jgi:hypothetical protein
MAGVEVTQLLFIRMEPLRSRLVDLSSLMSSVFLFPLCLRFTVSSACGSVSAAFVVVVVSFSGAIYLTWLTWPIDSE